VKRRSGSRLLLILLSFTLLSSPALAAGPRAEKEPGFAARLWKVVESLLPGIEKTRWTIDPNGEPVPESTGSETDGRGGMDPNGRT
jgi:hypothetical protein